MVEKNVAGIFMPAIFSLDFASREEREDKLRFTWTLASKSATPAASRSSAADSPRRNGARTGFRDARRAEGDDLAGVAILPRAGQLV
jgi:hypothetical protein